MFRSLGVVATAEQSSSSEEESSLSEDEGESESSEGEDPIILQKPCFKITETPYKTYGNEWDLHCSGCSGNSFFHAGTENSSCSKTLVKPCKMTLF